MFAQFRLVHFSSVCEAGFMSGESCLECVGCEADVDFFACGGGYLRFIDEIAGCAFPGKGAFVLLSAVACCFFAGGVMLADFVVMCLHYSCHIIHAAEAELHRVPVDDLVERAVFGEVCVYEA